ncbi:MAG: hypothetical protein IJ679_03585 [Lachnospiraceae bacterium]|nr:hypothetical protein [Lachnospiraceae bacterium]
MDGIVYQNKDIASKVFADRFKGKALRVYGLDVPEVVQVLPTNLPSIAANELRIDNVFLLADSTLAIVDYESQYKEKNKHKYIDYVNKVLAFYENEWGRRVEVRMIVIYTADVHRAEKHDYYDAGCLKFNIESAYLSEIDKAEVQRRLQEKAKKKEVFTDEEMMEFILLPLAYPGKEKQNTIIADNMDMISGMDDEEARVFMLSGLAVFSDKVITKDNAERVRRLIKMTKVGQLFIDEMESKLNEREAQVTKRVTQQVTQQVNSSNRETVMKNLREQHPDWSEERAQKEVQLLFA